MSAASPAWPSEIRLGPGKSVLHVTFDNAASFEYTAEFLRVMSPSAEVQGHHAAERRTVSGKRSIRIRRIEPVGHYAVRIVFDDLHDSGLYTWDYLYDLGRTMDARWEAYLAELEQKRLSRD